MIVEISNSQDLGLNEFIEKTLLDCNNYLLGKDLYSDSKEIQFSVAVVSEEEIQRLNRDYRKDDRPTDVLSFLYEDDENQLNGEIIVCPKVIENYAQQDGSEYKQELKKNLVHGFLHNLGYEHGDEMFGLQEEVLKAI